MSSVDPLVIGYSFTAARGGASDKVDLAALDAALALVTGKLNEIVAAIDVVTRDDDTLKDASIEPRHLSDEVVVDIAGQINQTYLAQGGT
jgi:hypothetical protein